MTSTVILSDNGASSGSAGIKTTGGNDGTLILQTTTSGGTATNAVYIDTVQNVGIGTASPFGKLTISNLGAAGFEFYTAYIGGGTGTYIQSYNRSGAAYVDTAYNALSHAFYISGTEKMRIDSSGKVNIGPSATALGQGYLAVYSDNAGAPATSGSTDAYIVTRSRVSSVALDQGTYGSGTSWIQNRSYNNYATNYGLALQPNGGDLYVGTTSALSGASKFSVLRTEATGVGIESYASSASFTGTMYVAYAARNTTNGSFSAFTYYNTGAGATRFYVSDGGRVYGTGTYVDLSDVTAKQNIRNLEVGLNEVLQLQPRRFDWIEGHGDGHDNKIGFIAQEVEQTIPDVVTQWDKEKGTKGVATAELIPVLVKAIQELNTKLEAQAAEIAALKGAQA